MDKMSVQKQRIEFAPIILQKEVEGLEVTTYRHSESAWQDEEGVRCPVLFFLGHGMIAKDYDYVIRAMYESGRDLIVVRNLGVHHQGRESDIHESLSHEQERVAETSLDMLQTLTPRMPKRINFLTDSAGSVHALIAACIHHAKNATGNSPLRINKIASVAPAGFAPVRSPNVLRGRGGEHVMREIIPKSFRAVDFFTALSKALKYTNWARRYYSDENNHSRLDDFARAEILPLIQDLTKKDGPAMHLFFPQDDAIFPRKHIEEFINKNSALFDRLRDGGKLTMSPFEGSHTALAHDPMTISRVLAWFDDETPQQG